MSSAMVSETLIRPGKLAPVNPRELWEYRELLYFLVWRDVKVRYKQAVIGVGWAVLQPLLAMMIFTVFFGLLAKIPSQGLPYPLFYYSALLPWTYFASALQAATNSVVQHQHVITKVYFPRVLLPVAAVLSGLVDLVFAFVVLLVMMWSYGITPSAAIVALPFFTLLAVAAALGVGLWLAAFNACYRDVRHAIPFLIQFWLFASPVVYPSSLVPEAFRGWYGLNPMAGVIDGFRWALLGSGQPPALLWISVVVVLGLLAGGLWYFRRVEGHLVDVV